MLLFNVALLQASDSDFDSDDKSEFNSYIEYNLREGIYAREYKDKKSSYESRRKASLSAIQKLKDLKTSTISNDEKQKEILKYATYNYLDGEQHWSIVKKIHKILPSPDTIYIFTSPIISNEAIEECVDLIIPSINQKLQQIDQFNPFFAQRMHDKIKKTNPVVEKETCAVDVQETPSLAATESESLFESFEENNTGTLRRRK